MKKNTIKIIAFFMILMLLISGCSNKNNKTLSIEEVEKKFDEKQKSFKVVEGVMDMEALFMKGTIQFHTDNEKGLTHTKSNFLGMDQETYVMVDKEGNSTIYSKQSDKNEWFKNYIPKTDGKENSLADASGLSMIDRVKEFKKNIKKEMELKDNTYIIKGTMDKKAYDSLPEKDKEAFKGLDSMFSEDFKINYEQILTADNFDLKSLTMEVKSGENVTVKIVLKDFKESKKELNIPEDIIKNAKEIKF